MFEQYNIHLSIHDKMSSDFKIRNPAQNKFYTYGKLPNLFSIIFSELKQTGI